MGVMRGSGCCSVRWRSDRLPERLQHRPRTLRERLALVAALVLPLVLAAGLLAWQVVERERAEDERAEDREVVNAATALTMAWASVDHREVDAYVEEVKAGATGPFLSQFENAEPFLRQTLEDNESVQVPAIPKDGAALLERRGDQARVIVAMDARVSNKNTKRPQPRQYRLQVQLEQESGEWLVSGLEIIDEQS